MSRIGKLPINVPEGVNINFNIDQVIVSGKLGALDMKLNDNVAFDYNQEEKKIYVKPVNNSKKAKAMWGLFRSLMNNMVKGVTEGFSVKLEINGVGYRASVENKILRLVLGHSHDILVVIPEGTKVECEKPTSISIFGADKQKVGQLAAIIRKFRAPEPYKGKGIKYATEKLIRKVGKKK